MSQEIWNPDLNQNLDFMFFENYGNQTASSKAVKRISDGEESLTDAQIQQYMNSIYSLYNYKWKHLFEVVTDLLSEDGGYNPLWNYDKNSTITEKSTRTPDLTHKTTDEGSDAVRNLIEERGREEHNTGADETINEILNRKRTEEHEGDDVTKDEPDTTQTNETQNDSSETINSRFTFDDNSQDGTPTDKSKVVNSHKDTVKMSGSDKSTLTHGEKITTEDENKDKSTLTHGHNVHVSETNDDTTTTTYGKISTLKDTGTEQFNKTTTEKTYGNIGVLTSGEALIKDVEAYKVYDFFKIVFTDILNHISIKYCESFY